MCWQKKTRIWGKVAIITFGFASLFGGCASIQKSCGGLAASHDGQYAGFIRTQAVWIGLVEGKKISETTEFIWLSLDSPVDKSRVRIHGPPNWNAGNGRIVEFSKSEPLAATLSGGMLTFIDLEKKRKVYVSTDVRTPQLPDQRFSFCNSLLVGQQDSDQHAELVKSIEFDDEPLRRNFISFLKKNDPNYHSEYHPATRYLDNNWIQWAFGFDQYFIDPTLTKAILVDHGAIAPRLLSDTILTPDFGRAIILRNNGEVIVKEIDWSKAKPIAEIKAPPE